MKSFAVLLVMLISPALLLAQSSNKKKKEKYEAYGWVRRGYDLDVLNEFVTQYNASRELDEDMMPFTVFSGFTYRSTILLSKRSWMGFGLNWTKQERTALYNVYGKQYRQGLRMESWTGSLGGGLRFALGKSTQLLVGVELEVGYLYLMERSYGVADGRPQWNRSNGQVALLLGPLLSLERGRPLGIALQPYYAYGFFPVQTGFLVETLVPAVDEAPSFGLTHYGLRVLLNFYEEDTFVKKIGKRL